MGQSSISVRFCSTLRRGGVHFWQYEIECIFFKAYCYIPLYSLLNSPQDGMYQLEYKSFWKESTCGQRSFS